MLNVDIHSNNLPSSNELIYINFGDVVAHTSLAMDHAIQIADEAGLKGDDRAALILAAMAHDLGKATTTATKEDGAITSHGHDMEGGPITEELLTKDSYSQDYD